MRYDYDLGVIGGGAAGLTAAGIAANLGVSALLIESHRLGGDCTWHGCVPSKTLIRAAEVVHTMRTAGEFGIPSASLDVDLAAVMEHVHAIRQQIYQEADEPEIYQRMGVDVAIGRGRFVDAHTIAIAGDDGSERRVTARYVVIATGSRPALPPITGLDEASFLTNETIFELTALPARLAVLGAGPVGLELAQAFQRLGSSVTVIDRSDRILAKDDPEHAAMLLEILRDEGIEFLLEADVTSVQRRETGVEVSMTIAGQQQQLHADALLVATGRSANVEHLNLEGAGISYDESGIIIDEHCRTTQHHIYACGDIIGRHQFTHLAEHAAKVATAHALLKLPKKLDSRHIPWCTFTSPNVAHLGESEADLYEKGRSFAVYRFPYSRLDRAITDGAATGQIKVFAKKWSGRILGVEIIGERAGDMIGEYAVAMRNGVSLRQIADTIHPYPTYALGNRRAADQWYARNQSAWMVKVIKFIFGYRGRVPDLSDEERII